MYICECVYVCLCVDMYVYMFICIDIYVTSMKQVFSASQCKTNPKKVDVGSMCRWGAPPPLCGFFKTVLSREIVEHWFFVTFNIIMGYIFPESFSEIFQIVQEI